MILASEGFKIVAEAWGVERPLGLFIVQSQMRRPGRPGRIVSLTPAPSGCSVTDGSTARSIPLMEGYTDDIGALSEASPARTAPRDGRFAGEAAHARESSRARKPMVFRACTTGGLCSGRLTPEITPPTICLFRQFPKQLRPSCLASQRYSKLESIDSRKAYIPNAEAILYCVSRSTTLVVETYHYES